MTRTAVDTKSRSMTLNCTTLRGRHRGKQWRLAPRGCNASPAPPLITVLSRTLKGSPPRRPRSQFGLRGHEVSGIYAQKESPPHKRRIKMIPVIIGTLVGSVLYDSVEYYAKNHTEAGKEAKKKALDDQADVICDRVLPRLSKLEGEVRRTRMAAEVMAGTSTTVTKQYWGRLDNIQAQIEGEKLEARPKKRKIEKLLEEYEELMESARGCGIAVDEYEPFLKQQKGNKSKKSKKGKVAHIEVHDKVKDLLPDFDPENPPNPQAQKAADEAIARERSKK